MNIKLHLKHLWKRMTLPGQSHIGKILRDFKRIRRQELIKKRKAIYDLSDMD